MSNTTPMRTWLLFLLLSPLCLFGQRISYSWPNMPCAVVLNCDTGCTACNIPVNENDQFQGTNVSLQGLDVCPHPHAVGDNVLYTYGWPTIPDAATRIVLSGIAMQPTALDSLVIVHGAEDDGPQRLQVELSLNGEPPVIVGDVYVDALGATVFTDLGSVVAGPSMIFGTFQLTLRAYQGQGGAFLLDDIRLVGGPMQVATSIHEYDQVARVLPTGADILGRMTREGTSGIRFSNGGGQVTP